MPERVFACETPEAEPIPNLTWFHVTRPCRGCLIAVEVAAVHYPGHVNSRGRTIEQIRDRARRTWRMTN